MAGPGAVDAQDELDRFDVLRGDLPDRLLGHRDLIDRVVRPSVAGTQLARQRLTGLIAIGQHRREPVATLKRARRRSFSECDVISVASRSIVNRSGAPTSSQTRARARA